MNIWNKRGSFTVFMVMAFAAVLIMVMGVFTAAGVLAIGSVTDAFGRLWGRSILAEYDLNLKDRYGIFAYYGEAGMVESKLDYYAGKTFQDKKYIVYEGARCSLEKYCLLDLDNFRAQIQQAVLFDSIPEGFPAMEEADATYGSRFIKNQWILQGLPSSSKSEEVAVAGIVNRVKNGELLESLMGNSAIHTYIFTYVKDHCDERELGRTYFQNEVEYIISGKADDEKAWKNVRNKLLVMRNLLNLYYLYTCPEKREAVMNLATLLTPGPEAVITQGVLMEGWALAEANNDLKLLQADRQVPLVKKDENWALALENVFSETCEKKMEESEENGKDYIEPERVEGSSYEEYLRILINFLSEETKLLRMMDLIQINMKYLYCDYFLMEDYYTGLEFSMGVNGASHEFEEFY